MSYARKAVVARVRVIAPAVLLMGLVACSGKEEPAAPAATAAGKAPAAAQTPPPAVSSSVQALGTAELRDLAGKALRENRMYAPAGDNAMEYYLALRDKTPDDASVKSALTDLLPYTLIAAEQNLGREDFEEGQRLIALIEKVDPNAPALPRLKQSVTRGMDDVARRSTDEAARAKTEGRKTRSSSRPSSSAWPSSAAVKPRPRSRLPPSRTPRAAPVKARTLNARRPSAVPPSSASSRPPPSRPPPPARPRRPCVRSARRHRATRPRPCARAPPAKCWWSSPWAPTVRW